mmetsp:Transcript_29232/g.59858  ORF Transcript_29232/g.59858 Transcript_29232/m.59858 type:complete len:1035 (+) Transcript_29232:497-3601(+)
MSVEGVESNILSGESDDIATSLRSPTTPRFTPGRTKGYSDISGMILREAPYNSRMMPFHTTGLDKLSEKDQEILQEEILNAAAKSGRKKTKSDVAAMMALGFLDGGIDNVVPRKRQISSSDVVTKFGYAPQLGYEDLRMAEAVIHLGTTRERESSNISDMVMKNIIEVTPKEEEQFPFNHVGLTSAEAAALLVKYGKNELPEKVTPKWLVLLQQFWAPMPIMIWIAIIIEIGIQNFIDMGILLLIQFTNASISFYELNKAGNAVAALKSSLKPMATCKRDGGWQVMDATLLVPGDLVLLGSGSAIPADCRVNSSEIDVDQAALTGESLPVTFYKGDSCKMGSTVVRGEVEATVEFTGVNTFFGKTASLLQESNEHSHLQKMLMRIMFILVGLSVSLCLINFIYLMAEGEGLKESLSHTIVLLVASIPLAIEIVTNTTLAIGSKSLSHRGAIVARLSAIEDLAGMSILCSDKTGTLTLNKMVLQDDTPVYSPGENQESVLVYAALAAKWKEPPRDALDRLTLGSVNMTFLENYEQTEFLPFDPTIKRTEGTLRNLKTGAEFKTTKGAPHIILQLLNESEKAVIEQVEADVTKFGEMGIRSMGVAKMDLKDGKNEWKMMGLLTFLDPPRPDTKQTIIDANKFGVNVKMITGDHLLIAKQTASVLSMGDKIFGSENLPMLDPETKQKPANLGKTYGNLCLAADGFAQVFPEHKFLIVETLRELGYSVGMTGDGVNDAPALKRADVGIAVAGSTDAARAAAAIILTEEGLSTIIHGIIIAREIFSRISNFITYRISATLQLLLFFFIAIFAFHPSSYQPEDSEDEWPEYFHMPVLMLMLITLLNDGTLITIAYDYAEASPTPTKWNIPALFITSTVLGMVSCFSSLLVLYILLDSHDPNGLFAKIGMSGVDYGQITAAIYLKVSVSDFLTLFSARTGPKFFWQVRPAPVLLIGGTVALTVSSLLSIVWPVSEPDGIMTEGLSSNMGVFVFVWLYCLVFWIVQDFAKVASYKYMYHSNFNGINDTGVIGDIVPPKDSLV